MGGRSSAVKRSLPDIYNDLEHSKPSSEEAPIFNEFQASVIEPSSDILERFSNYKDGQDLAGRALANPSEETKGAAWDAIYPNVVLQMEVFDFGKTVSEKFLMLIRTVLDLTSSKKNDVFATSPAILKCFVDCFNIILEFDEIKLKLPKLLNDLAFFRRNVAQYNDDCSLDDLLDKSNMSTIFWAAPMPMLGDAIKSLSEAYHSPNDQKRLFTLLGNVADLCTTICMKNKGNDVKPSILCLRCIVGATLIIDNLSDRGAFTKKSYFGIKDSMKLLVKFQPKQTSLINAIVYSSKHLKDDQSDPKIQRLFR